MKGEVTRIQWSPTATDFFAASSLDKTVQIFDAKRKPLSLLSGVDAQTD